MELGQLRALRELGERGSIAAVAVAWHVTPSSVSQQISALQKQSAAPLTYKDGRRTTLTDAGRALALAAVEVEVALTRAERAITHFQDVDSGSVSVTAFHSAGTAFFGPLLRAMAGPGQPRLTFSDFDVSQGDFPVLTADHDLVVAHRLVGTPPWPSTVRAEPVMFEPLDIAMHRDHPLAAHRSIAPHNLVCQDWIAVHEGFPLEQAITLLAGIGDTEVRIAHRINDFHVAATVVAASECVALLPRYTTDLHQHPDLVLRPLSQPRLGRYVDCLARPETLERANVQTVLGALRQIVAGITHATH